MRRLLQILSASDRDLVLLVAGLLIVALVCRVFMRETTTIPGGKTVLTIVRGGYKRDREQLKELLAAFARQRPDIHIQVIQTNQERKTDTMLAAGIPPDLIYLGVDNVNFYLDADALLDLTPYVDRDPDLRAVLRGDDGRSPDFFPQLLKPFVRGAAPQSRLYAIPTHYNAFMVYYSRDLFDRYRVPYPDENWDWEGLRQRAIALTRDEAGRRPDQPGFDPQHVVSYGFHYATWQHGIEPFIRQAGGRLISEDGLRVVADDPATIRALQFLYDLKFKDRVTPPGSARQRNIGFSKGTLGMYLYAIFGVSTFRSEAPNLDWDVAPLPRGPDGRRASLVYAYGWGISKACKHPEAAFALLKFFAGQQAMEITSRHLVFLPARRSVLERALRPDAALPPRSTWVFTHDVEHGYAEPPFSTRQYYMDVYEAVNEHIEGLLALDRPVFSSPAECAASLTREGNRILARDRSVRGATFYGRLAIGLAALPAGWLLWVFWRRRRAPLTPLARSEERWGYALISPWIAGFVIFSAGPIVLSLLLSFAHWQALGGFARSEFVGIENYRTALAGEDPKFYRSLWVTLRYALLAVPAGLIGGLALALLMNQKVRGIRVFRTLYYLPAILPSVAVAVLWWYLFDANFGWVNRVLARLNGTFGGLFPRGWIAEALARVQISWPIQWFDDARVVPYVFILMSLWAVGGGMLIYLAGLQSIPTELYDAAQIDGASRWRRLVHVTLPMLSPVILFNLVMGIIGSFQVFNVAYVLYEGTTGPKDSALFYGLHLFREAFLKYRLGYASALAWILFVIILALTALVFKSSPLWVHYERARRARA